MVTLLGRARRALLLVVAAGALASCGIPTTGVVQAGGPASGVVPTTWVYLVRDGTLIAVRRRTDAPGDAETALRSLLLGPTDAERLKGLTTRLPLPRAVPTAAPAVPDGGATALPNAPRWADLVKVTARDHRISVELSFPAAELTDPRLAAAQLACTAEAAQRTAASGAEPGPVTVTLANGLRVDTAATRCPVPEPS
ncbi:hypothetical protein AB5J52_44015 [Streptomyces sp. R39]|uniref:GerMN domain-containing protein n=1 Tax=Streptomyces sp. R39 TaxID=3238631 RepID=A0AB39R279_9ACTN